MAPTFEKTSLPGVIRIEPNIFTDDRGYFKETYQRDQYAAEGIDAVFVQDNHSHSVRGVLRGLHYQLRHPQAKLVQVISGEIFDVAVDIRRGSPSFGQWVGVGLSGRQGSQLFIPAGFAHGFCVLSETADVLYKCTDFYAPGDEYGIFWADPAVGIVWPADEPILSGKDRRYPGLDTIPEGLLPLYDRRR